MFGVIVASVVVAGAAVFVYLVRERLGARGLGMAALRTTALGALLMLLVNPTGERSADAGPPTVLLDASLSFAVEGGHWAAARDSARALAGARGVILRVGDGVAPFDSSPPTASISTVRAGLQAAAGRGGPVYLLTDGELSDFDALPRVLREKVAVVVFPRDTVPNAALLDVALPERVQVEDSITVTLEVGTWGALTTDSGWVEITDGDRVIARESVRLPPPPGVGRRTVRIPQGALSAGTHVLSIVLTTAGDEEPADDRRERMVTVSALPAIVLVARPADWESRFLMTTLRDVTEAPIRGFAQIAEDRWIEMRSLEPVTADRVRRAARSAALLIVRGDWSATASRQPRWRWPSASGTVRFAAGDWYPVGTIPASPLGGPLGAIEWDSLPPLTGIVPIAPVDGEWIALSGRLGRRGAERPVLVGRDSAGIREMTTAAGGLWRWSLRGGASAEAYRGLLAAGVDWLLGGAGATSGVTVTATRVVPRGVPVVFRWRAGDPPAEPRVQLTGPDSTYAVPLVFDDQRRANLRLDPGVYRWRIDGTPGAQGTTVVEAFSDEYPPGPVTATASVAAESVYTLLRNAREYWWVFVLAVAALVGEWAWRIRRGLP